MTARLIGLSAAELDALPVGSVFASVGAFTTHHILKCSDGRWCVPYAGESFAADTVKMEIQTRDLHSLASWALTGGVS